MQRPRIRIQPAGQPDGRYPQLPERQEHQHGCHRLAPPKPVAGTEIMDQPHGDLIEREHEDQIEEQLQEARPLPAHVPAYPPLAARLTHPSPPGAGFRNSQSVPSRKDDHCT
jgi:hypothetical protein